MTANGVGTSWLNECETDRQAPHAITKRDNNAPHSSYSSQSYIEAHQNKVSFPLGKNNQLFMQDNAYIHTSRIELFGESIKMAMSTTTRVSAW